MQKQGPWGTVNLGVDVLQGHGEQTQPGLDQYTSEHPHTKNKQQYNPGRNQELKLPPDIFRMQKNTEVNPYSPNGKINTKGMHERIKEMLGEGISKREAVIRARQEAEKFDHGDVGTITKKELYQSKYQAEKPTKQPSVFTENVQGYPYI